MEIKKGANAGYFKNIVEGISSSFTGMKLTLRHFFRAWKKSRYNDIQQDQYFSDKSGLVTVQYPHEALPVPDNGRYRLHNEIDDCIVCDLCAKICPVNCIEIEPVKSTEEIGKTSDGTTKRIYAATFDIDMAKCCYCGLCTTVCPTECLTMTKTYDYSEFDVRNMNYHFTNLSPEEAVEKRDKLAKQQAEKNVKKNLPAGSEIKGDTAADKPATPATPARPVFKPVIKNPSGTKNANTAGADESEKSGSGSLENQEQNINNQEKVEDAPKPKPVFKPVIKKSTVQVPKIENKEKELSKDDLPADSTEKLKEKSPDAPEDSAKKIPPKPVFKPVIKAKDFKNKPEQENIPPTPPTPPQDKEDGIADRAQTKTETQDPGSEEQPKTPKPFKPVIKVPPRKQEDKPDQHENEK